MTKVLARVEDWDHLVPGEHVLLARLHSDYRPEMIGATFVHATSDGERRRWQGTFIVERVTGSCYDSDLWSVHRPTAPDQPAPSVPAQQLPDDVVWHRYSLRDPADFRPGVG